MPMTDSLNLADARLLTRTEWVNACAFHDLSEDEVLREIYRRVSDLKSQAGVGKGAHPLVLLDLDSTLYEVGPRTFRILKEWSESEEGGKHPELRTAMLRVGEHHVGYSIRDTLRAVGLDAEDPRHEGAFGSIKQFWAERFFTSEYLKYDRAYPGAAEFTREVHALGAEVVYLTGRDEPNMGEGTRDNLLRDGFPWKTERTRLLLKPAAHLPDLGHKQQAAEYIRGHGTLVASFENEPANLVALYEIFPDAMHVFVETVCSDHAAIPRQGLYRIQGFSTTS